jgi:hypothetical protein
MTWGWVADLVGFVRQVVRIDADAVASHQSGLERQEVPFRTRGGQDIVRVDAEFAEQQGKLVDEGDVDVALGVLDDLRGFGDANRGGAVGSGRDDALVETVDELCGLRGGPAGDLDDRAQTALRPSGRKSRRP